MMSKAFKKKPLEQASELLRLLSNPQRLKIVCFLHEGEKNVGELEERLQLSQSALSQHLARLRQAKAVRTRKEAQMVYYSLSDKAVEQVIATLHGIYCA